MIPRRLLAILALASLAQAPVRAELILDNPAYRQGSGIRPWSRGHDVATVQCNTAALGARVGSARGVTVGIHGESQLDQTMDTLDRACLGHALEWAPERRPVSWKNSRSGATYDFVLIRKEDRNGVHCRFFQGSSVRDGLRTPWRGKACRAADGIWRIA